MNIIFNTSAIMFLAHKLNKSDRYTLSSAMKKAWSLAKAQKAKYIETGSIACVKCLIIELVEGKGEVQPKRSVRKLAGDVELHIESWGVRIVLDQSSSHVLSNSQIEKRSVRGLMNSLRDQGAYYRGKGAAILDEKCKRFHDRLALSLSLIKASN